MTPVAGGSTSTGSPGRGNHGKVGGEGSQRGRLCHLWVARMHSETAALLPGAVGLAGAAEASMAAAAASAYVGESSVHATVFTPTLDAWLRHFASFYTNRRHAPSP